MTVAETRQQRTDRASQAIGRLLLQAWTMLDETCPNANCGCVLMQAPNRGRKSCVLCGDLPSTAAGPAPVAAPAVPIVDSALMDLNDDHQDDDVQHQLALETERQRARLLAASASAAPLPAPTATATTTTVIEPSRLLGQRMLQGWTLLGDVCPVCTDVPLVSKDNVRECVVCGPLASARPLSSTSPRAPAQRATSPPPPPRPATSRPVAATGVAPATAPVPTPASASLDVHAIVQNKILHVAAKLDAADRVADIQHCAQVLRELLALQKDLA